jgi:hypothetical protein
MFVSPVTFVFSPRMGRGEGEGGIIDPASFQISYLRGLKKYLTKWLEISLKTWHKEAS